MNRKDGMGVRYGPGPGLQTVYRDNGTKHVQTASGFR